MGRGIVNRVSPVFTLSGGIAALGFGLLALVVVLDIFVRNLGLAKWPWLNEITEYLLTISTFGGAPWVLRQSAHVNVDVVLRLLPRAVAFHATRLSYLLGLVISGLVTWLAITAARDSYSIGSMVFKNLVFPEWWMMVPVIWCFGLCSLEFFLRIVARSGA